MDRITIYWQNIALDAGVIPSFERPHGVEIILQMAPAEQGDVVAGYVCLSSTWSETGPFRAEVLKLMVSPDFRRMGVAKRVMGMLEDVARERGRGLLVSTVYPFLLICSLNLFLVAKCADEKDRKTLDTKVGTDAELVYPKLGWTELGVVPKYGIDPVTKELVDERFFYKDLREHAK